MSLVKKIVGQSAVYFLGTVIAVVIGFFFKIYLSRILGADALGVYSLGLTAISVLGIFLSLGYGNGLVRFISKYKATQNNEKLLYYISNTSIINLCIVVPLSVVFYLFPEMVAVNILNTDSLIEYIPLFGVMMFVNSFLVLAEQSIRGLQEVRKSTLINTFFRLPFKIGLAVLFFSWGWGLEGYIVAELLGSALTLILLVILLKKLLPLASNYRFKKTTYNKEEKKYSSNLLITNSVLALGRHGDKLVLVYYLSTFELGIYSVVLTIAAFIPLVLTSVNSIFSPIISQLYSEDRLKDLARYFQLSGRYVFILSFPLMVFLFLFSEPIMSVFGYEFRQGSSLLILVVVGQFINLSMGSVGLMLQMTGFEKPMRNVSIITSFVSFFLYIILINKWGLIGLGIVYILNMFLQNTAYTYVLYKRLNIQLFHKDYIKVIILFFSLFFACYLISDGAIFDVNTLFLACAFFGIYVLYIFSWLIFFGKKELPQVLKSLNLTF